MYIGEVMLNTLDFGGHGSLLELMVNPWKQLKKIEMDRLRGHRF